MIEPTSDAQERYELACERRDALYRAWEAEGSPWLAEGSKKQVIEHPLIGQMNAMDLLCDRLDPNKKHHRPGRKPEAQIRALMGESPAAKLRRVK